MSEIVEWLEPQSSYEELASWSILAFLFSSMYALWRWRKWRGETWLSLLTWTCMVGAFAEWSTTVDWMPRATNHIYFSAVSSAWYRELAGWPAQLLDLGTWITVSMFLVVLGLHTRGDGDIAIGGRWRAVWAAVLGVIVAVLMARFNPVHLNDGPVYRYWAEEYDRTLLETITDLFIAWPAIMLPLVSAFAVMAWKTRASLFVTDEKMAVGLGRGLGLFRIRWKRVVRVTEVVENGERRSVIVEHGVLPWYRLRIGLHLRRDGAEALDQVWRHAPNKRRTDLRRGTRLAGYLLLASALVCVAIIRLTSYKSYALMGSSSDEFVQNFVGQDHFLLFGLLMIGASLFLGMGSGALFAQNYAGVRALPLVGVALCASLLPDPMIYWLVYIALYAILVGRLGPIESHPYIPFPDVRVMEFGMWAADAKALLAIIGYVIGTMIVLKPWTRFLPGWPYRLPGSRLQPGDTSDTSDP